MMSEQLTVLPEPPLEFRHQQGVVDPHLGLTLFGPFDADRTSKPVVSYALIGPQDDADAFLQFAELWQLPIPAPRGKSARLWPMFPGFETAFGTRWPDSPTRSLHIDEASLDVDTRHLDPNQIGRAHV